MLEKIKLNKKIILMLAMCIFVLSIACVNASEATPTPADYSGLVNQLETGLGANAFIEVLSDILPYIMMVTIVALVWYLIKRAIKKFSKGKPGV